MKTNLIENRINKLTLAAAEHGVTASIRSLGGNIFANINGCSFVVNSHESFVAKCKELKNYQAPAPIDLTARLVKIENSALECIG